VDGVDSHQIGDVPTESNPIRLFVFGFTNGRTTKMAAAKKKPAAKKPAAKKPAAKKKKK
jgi:hypothetical protein